MNLKEEIENALNSYDCEDCGLAIYVGGTSTDPACFDCRLSTAEQFALDCPAIETAVQEQAFEVYQDALDDGGFVPVHQTYTKQTVFRVQRGL